MQRIPLFSQHGTVCLSDRCVADCGKTLYSIRFIAPDNISSLTRDDWYGPLSYNPNMHQQMISSLFLLPSGFVMRSSKYIIMGMIRRVLYISLEVLKLAHSSPFCSGHRIHDGAVYYIKYLSDRPASERHALWRNVGDSSNYKSECGREHPTATWRNCRN